MLRLPASLKNQIFGELVALRTRLSGKLIGNDRPSMPRHSGIPGSRSGASIRDVAARAGVSTATVSRVLNGTLSATAKTRQRVLDAIQELGYSQNTTARDLARGRSSLLGLIISDVRNPFFPDITAAFQDQALAHDMDALVLNTNYDSQRTLNSVKRVLALQVPGVAILTSQIDPSVIDMVAAKHVAAVYLDLGRVGRGISNIVIDYEHGIAEALDCLVQLGHRKIAYIGGPVHMHSAQRRKRAFVEGARTIGRGSNSDHRFGLLSEGRLFRLLETAKRANADRDRGWK